MFERIINFFKGLAKKEKQEVNTSKDTAKERLHLVLMQDRANVSADFLELMKQEIIEVIKKYIEVDEGAIDVRLTNKANDDGTTGAPALYANIPIMNIKHEMGKEPKAKEEDNKEEKIEEEKQEKSEEEQSIKEVEKEENIEEESAEENTKKETTEGTEEDSNSDEEVAEKIEK